MVQCAELHSEGGLFNNRLGGSVTRISVAKVAFLMSVLNHDQHEKQLPLRFTVQ
jgi:hypothetical protein